MAGSILKEITFTPQTFDKEFLMNHRKRISRLIAIFESLAVERNGMIVTVSKNWHEIVYELLKTLHPEDYYDIKSLIENLEQNQQIVTYPNKKVLLTEDEYIQQITLLNTIRNFDFISGTINNDIVKTLEKITPESYLNKGAKVEKQTVEFMKKMLAPILSYSEKIQIIDPYFNFVPISGNQDRYMTTMEIICQNLSNHHGIKEQGKIIIHTSVKAISRREGSGKPILKWKYTNEWKNRIELLEKKYNHEIFIYIWEELKEEDEWHDRYIESNQCCISIGKGTDISNWTDSTWTTVDFNNATQIIKKFNPNRSNNYIFIASISSSSNLQIKNENLTKIKTVEVYKTEEELKIEEEEYLQNSKIEEKIRQEKLNKQPKSFFKSTIYPKKTN